MIKDEIAIDGGIRMRDDTARMPAPHDDAAAAPRAAMRQMWRRLDAALVHDSREVLPTPGVRAVRTGFPRLLYRAHGYEVDLRIRPSSMAGRWRLLGQVVDDEFEPCSGWVVVENGAGFVKTGLDSCGHFSVDGLVAGRHRFAVDMPNATIEIGAVYL